MKNLVFTMALVVFSSLQTSAANDIWKSYETLATELVQELDAETKNPSHIQADLNELVRLGYQMMALYDKKFIECTVQYLIVQKEDSLMKTATYAQLESRYHDGLGLPEAPKHCYAARSMVIHPYMAAAMLREGLDGASHEIEEVATRAVKIKTKLGL